MSTWLVGAVCMTFAGLGLLHQGALWVVSAWRDAFPKADGKEGRRTC